VFASWFDAMAADELLLLLLRQNNHDVVYTSCGVLMNMIIDAHTCHVFRENGGVAILIEV
jgi:rRNA-processing protein FCF1